MVYTHKKLRRLNILKVCVGSTTSSYNILPAIVYTPKTYGFKVALKFWKYHLGLAYCRNLRNDPNE